VNALSATPGRNHTRQSRRIILGATKGMTWNFFAQYCDEAHAPLSHDWLNAQGTDPEGVDISALEADLSALQTAPRTQ
jgi:hypothetical protein